MPAGAGTGRYAVELLALRLPDFVFRFYRAQAAGVESDRVRAGDGVSGEKEKANGQKNIRRLLR